MERAPWFVAGPAMGLVIVGLLWVANRPLGALGGYVDAFTWMKRPSSKVGWRAFFLLGVVLGGLVFALVSGGLHPTTSYGGFVGQLSPVARVAALVGAGALIGYGARTAGGCTSGHGLCGMSLGSPASVVATMMFMMTAVAAAHALLWIGGAS